MKAVPMSLTSKTLASAPEDEMNAIMHDTLTTLFGEPQIEDDEGASETRYGPLVMRVAAQVGYLPLILLSSEV